MKNIVDFVALRVGLKRTFLSLAVCVIGASFCINLSYLINQFSFVKPFGYLSGAVSRSEYITQYRPEFPLIEFANQQLSFDDQILGIFLGNRGYYFDVPIIFDMHQGKSILVEIVNNADTVTSLMKQIHDRGFTHIFLRNDMFMSWFPQTLSVEKITLLESFFATNTKLLKNINGHSLYELDLDGKLK